MYCVRCAERLRYHADAGAYVVFLCYGCGATYHALPDS